MRRAGLACLLVAAVYVALSFLNSSRGFLGTDTGGKVATLEVMTASGRFDPDLGYWAERWDPDGSLHPIGFTSHTSSGKWVNVTTLPALWVGWQLYQVGGYRLALLVPMAGSLAASLAGLALLRRLGVRSDTWAWTGFFVLALASPLTIYALDFWEHSLGVALMAWAVVLLIDSMSSFAWSRVAAAGALFGVAATMRTETLVYLAVAGVALTLSLLQPFRARSGASGTPRRAQIGRAAGAVPLLVASAAVPLVLNEVVERRVVGSTIRATRVLGTAASVGDLPTDRVREAAITLVGLEGGDLGIALGLVFVGLLVFSATRTDPGLSMVATAAAGGVLVLRGIAGGLGFVPGLLTAWVLPASRLGRRGIEVADEPAGSRPDAERFVLGVALGAVPIVLATQFRGGAAPQWAGRYLLPSGLLLAAAGWASLSRRDRTGVARATVGLAAAVTVFGLCWVSVRTHDVARTVSALDSRPEEVVVSDVYHLAREGGATYGDRRWLTLERGRPGADAASAAAVLTEAGVAAFAAVEQSTSSSDRLDFPGFEPTDRTTLRLFDGVDLRITRWEAAP